MKRPVPNIPALPENVDPRIKQAFAEILDYLKEIAAEQGGVAASTMKEGAVPWTKVSKEQAKTKDVSPDVAGVFEIDVTSNDSVKNKAVSNLLGKTWENHRKRDYTGTVQSSEDTAGAHGMRAVDVTDSNATKNKMVSNANGKKWEDHVDASQNVHGIGSGNAVVGTGTAQTLTNKKFGGVDNYSEFEADGTLRFRGDATVWRDDNFPGVSLGVGASPPDSIPLNGGTIYVRAFDGVATVEQLFFGTEYNHEAEEGADIIFHVHWSPTTADAGNVKWQLTYKWVEHGVGFAGAETTISATQAASGVAWDDQKISFPTVSGAGKTIGSQIVGRLFRDPTDAADTYAHDAAITGTFGYHYEMDTHGSREILTK